VMLFSETWGNQIPETGMLIGSWERHGESVVPLGTRYPLRQMPYSSLIQRDRPTLIKDINADERIDPQTRSALAPLGKSVAIFPMVSREQWIGWLSVVANDPETLEQEEIRQISSLVDQATTVIQTIQLFQQTQSALVATQESEKLVRTIIDSTPDWIYIRDRDHRYRLVNTEYANAMHIQPELFLNKTDLELGLSEEMVKENIEKGLSGFWADDQKVMETGEPVVYPSEPIMINGSLRVFNTFRTPLKDNEGKAWGVLTFSRDVTEHELAQAALARRARELNLVANIGTQVSAILEPGLMLQTVADRIQESFRLYHAHIYLVNENKDTLTLTGGAGEVGRKLVAQGWQIPLGQEQSLVARAARTRQGVIVNDVSIDPNFLPNELLPNTRAEMAIPLIVGDQVLGVLDVQADQINRFSEEDVNIQTTLAVQVAVALQNARTYDQTQREAEYEALVNTISQRIQNTTTVEGALQVAIRELGRALGASKTYVQLGLSRQQPKV
jgi:PAS domain S-box-containing protein